MFDEVNYEDEEFKEQQTGLIAKGFYDCIIDKCEHQLRDDGDLVLALTFKVIEGEFKNRLVFKNLFLQSIDDGIRQKAKQYWINLNITSGMQCSPNEPQKLLYKQIRLYIDQYDFDGKKGNYISWQKEKIKIKNPTNITDEEEVPF